jgi:hypothetical protein
VGEKENRKEYKRRNREEGRGRMLGAKGTGMMLGAKETGYKRGLDKIEILTSAHLYSKRYYY